MQPYSCGGLYIPQSSPVPSLPAPLQWVGAPTSRPDDVWGPCLPSTVPPSGETPWGTSPTGGSGTTSQTKTIAPLATLPCRTSPPFSYPLPPSIISLSAIPILPAPSVGSVPLLANCCHWMTTFIPSTTTKRFPSAVYHTRKRPAPSNIPYPWPENSFTSSQSRSRTSLKSGVPNWGPPVGKTCHTGGTTGGVDSPPTGWLCCPEGVDRQSVPIGFSVRTLSHGIPTQGTSIGKG